MPQACCLRFFGPDIALLRSLHYLSVRRRAPQQLFPMPDRPRKPTAVRATNAKAPDRPRMHPTVQLLQYYQYACPDILYNVLHVGAYHEGLRVPKGAA